MQAEESAFLLASCRLQFILFERLKSERAKKIVIGDK